MKKALAFIVLIGFAATLGAQSVAELARREKERRQSLGDRRAPIITNLDLLRSKKRPAIDVPPPVTDIDEFDDEADLDEAKRIPPPAAPAGDVAAEPDTGPKLEDQLNQVRGIIDLLTTKIAALKQAYSSQENMVPNYVIEQQLDETLERLREAEAQEARILGDIDRRNRERRRPSGPAS